MFSGGFVVCLCGLHFVVEGAYESAPSFVAYLGIPFLRLVLEAYTFVLRGWVLFEVYAVVTVLPVCCGSQVSFSIVEPVVVDVIDVQFVRRIENIAVHLDVFPLACAHVYPPDGVIGGPGLVGVPFVLVQTLEVVRIYDSVLALGKGYPAKGIAVAEAPIAKRQNHNRARQPVWNSDGEIERDDDHPRRVLKNREKSEILSSQCETRPNEEKPKAQNVLNIRNSGFRF